VKGLIFILPILFFCGGMQAQPANCTFEKPRVTIHFGAGNVRDINTAIYDYERVPHSCPSDGHYAYSSYMSDCFSGDWFNLAEDHTPGDASGNMLIVNSSYNTGTFFKTTVNALRGGMTYEFGIWLMNVCRITDKCPFPLLPNITIRLQTTSGKTVAQLGTGEVERVPSPRWAQHRTIFTMPASETSLILTMTNSKPGGCGNDFALDDITFRECIIKPKPVAKTPAKKPVVAKKQPTLVKKPQKTTPVTASKPQRVPKLVTTQKDAQPYSAPVVRLKTRAFPPPPPVLTTRANTLAKKIETGSGEININLYDNGQIDGDTISIYHNNVLLVSHARLSAKPISLKIAVDSLQPHHELVMVAENLGSIPPNTSLMIITAGNQRYEVFISSTEQKNAKVILDLKE
jgi:hypothetical protein